MKTPASFLIALACTGVAHAAASSTAAPGALRLDVAPAAYAGVGAARPEWRVAASTPAEQTLTWPAFIREVLSANLDYAATRYDVDMAAADAAAARLLPNPTLSLSGDRDLSYHDKVGIGSDGQRTRLRQVESRSVGLTETIELGGKRKWRIKAADQSLRAAAATLDDFLRNLKLDAAAAFADALAAQKNVERLDAAAGFATRLSEAQRTRYTAGDIGKPDVTQAQLEEVQLRNDLMKAEADAEAARYALSTFLGRDRGQTRFVVSGELQSPQRDYDVARIVGEALLKRPDLIALRHARDAADSGVKLAKTAAVPDIDVGLTYTHNGGVTLNHPVDPTPAFNALQLSLSMPLPLFDRGQYGVRKAFAAADQAQVRLDEAELRAETGIRNADAQYRSALRRLGAYRDDILKGADSLLEARRYSYQRGASTLLELIEAQRAANDTRQAYDEALTDAIKALIEFERASGIDQGIEFR